MTGNLKKIGLIYILILCIFLITFSCKDSRQSEPKKTKVITTLFPLYDFTRNIGGQYVDVFLLLPPGVEPHTFEPRPEDIVRINSADIFIFTGKYMEPWVDKILKGIDNKKILVIDSSEGIKPIELVEDSHTHNHIHKVDPHIWLDFENAQTMVDNILRALIIVDPENEKYYQHNADNYKSALLRLDSEFKEGLALCKTRYFIHGGHFAFGYMAKRYRLNYISAYEGLSPDAEPSARHLATLIKIIKKYNAKYIFYEELISPKIAEMISKETGAGLLRLHAAHNLTKDEFDRGITFIELMKQNLLNLKTGLQCQ